MKKKKVEKAEAEPKVVKVRRWVFEEETYDDTKCQLTRTNDGFDVLELLGLLDLAREEILSTIKGQPPHFDTIKRQVVKD